MTARECKYGCGTQIEWDKTLFRESKTAEPHTQERCKLIKNQKGLADTANKTVNSSLTDKNQLTRIEQRVESTYQLLEATLKKLGLFGTADGKPVGAG